MRDLGPLVQIIIIFFIIFFESVSLCITFIFEIVCMFNNVYIFIALILEKVFFFFFKETFPKR